MKNTFTIISLLSLLLTGCSYDDNSYSPNEGTDFNKDISELLDFKLSTPIELKVINKEYNGSNLEYKVGDTLKIQLEINEVHRETRSNSFNLYKSTGSKFYTYSINFNQINGFRFPKMIDLELLEKHPEILKKRLNDIQIRTSPEFKFLFLDQNEILAEYNSETKKYVSKIGIVLDKVLITSFNNIEYSRYTTNLTSNKNINISVPIASSLDNSNGQLIVTE